MVGELKEQRFVHCHCAGHKGKCPDPYTREVILEDCRIPADRLLGKLGLGFIITMKTLDLARPGAGALAVGLAQSALDEAAAFAKERQQFGAPIFSFQAVQHMLADMAAKVYAMETMLYRTAWMCDEHLPHTRESGIVKLYCSEALCEIADAAMQIHGGMGYMREYPVERFYRDARINRIFEGTNEIQRLVIARDLIKHNGY